MGCASTSLPNTAKTVKLPKAIGNNAAAYHHASHTVYSFAGLGRGKDYQDVSADAFMCALDDKHCVQINPLPDGVGRLAATAQILKDKIYIFGGYSVAKDGHEVSTPDVFAFDVKTKSYARKKNMPLPVDDSVSALYQDRYIYLVSGWHTDDNVHAVQVYDTKTDTWTKATDWPGKAVFGHAGGLVDNTLVICDGVYVVPPKPPKTRRSFATISTCWRGDIDPKHPQKIKWKTLNRPNGKGLYRMAATAWPQKHMVVFAGGTDNAYNYNGIGYNKVPSQPSAMVWGYNVQMDTFIRFQDKPVATMDHRQLLHLDGNRFLTVGGMGADQDVLDRLYSFEIRR